MPFQRNDHHWFAISWIVTCSVLAGAGCGEPIDRSDRTGETASLERTGQTLGAPEEGYPSYSERLVFYLTNRARTEPEAFNEEEPHPAAPPLRWNLALSKAARWQARHISEDGCWCKDHSSCCDVARRGGSVECAGSTGSCGGTSAEERVSLWSSAYSGENAGNGYEDARKAVDGWIHSSGHWKNLTNPEHSLLGVGHHGAGWVQDFGRGGGSPPVATGGIHFGDGDSSTFGLTYHQPETGGPRSIMAVIDGQCHDLDLAYGDPELGAFETTVTLGEGCHRYYFHVTDGQGEYHSYPSEGSLGVGIGTEDCELYSRRRPADSCSPSGQSCETGDTRRCYTGPYETEGVGACESGSQRCIGGDWTETCRYETLPADSETCGNGRDDDCDGTVDESCGGGDDAAAGADAGRDSNRGGRGGAGCTATGRPTNPLSPVAWLLVAIGGVGCRRRWSSDVGASDLD